MGRNDSDLESAIWTRTSRFKWDGQDYQQEETYFLVTTEEFDVGEGGEMDGEDERAVVKAFRWWNTDEIHESSETFAPRDLGDLLVRLIVDGPPEEPIHTGL